MLWASPATVVCFKHSLDRVLPDPPNSSLGQSPKTLSLKPGQLLRGSQHVCNVNISVERTARGSRLFSTDRHCLTRVTDDDILLHDYFHDTGVSPLLLHWGPISAGAQGPGLCRGKAQLCLGTAVISYPCQWPTSQLTPALPLISTDLFSPLCN